MMKVYLIDGPYRGRTFTSSTALNDSLTVEFMDGGEVEYHRLQRDTELGEAAYTSRADHPSRRRDQG